MRQNIKAFQLPTYLSYQQSWADKKHTQYVFMSVCKSLHHAFLKYMVNNGATWLYNTVAPLYNVKDIKVKYFLFMYRTNILRDPCMCVYVCMCGLSTCSYPCHHPLWSPALQWRCRGRCRADWTVLCPWCLPAVKNAERPWRNCTRYGWPGWKRKRKTESFTDRKDLVAWSL